jgi:hypothetical protein
MVAFIYIARDGYGIGRILKKQEPHPVFSPLRRRRDLILELGKVRFPIGLIGELLEWVRHDLASGRQGSLRIAG